MPHTIQFLGYREEVERDMVFIQTPECFPDRLVALDKEVILFRNYSAIDTGVFTKK
jgi:hypothetical protein